MEGRTTDHDVDGGGVSRGGPREGAGRPRTFAEGPAVPRTVRLPAAVWALLEERARAEGLTVAQLVATLAGPA